MEEPDSLLNELRRLQIKIMEGCPPLDTIEGGTSECLGWELAHSSWVLANNLAMQLYIQESDLEEPRH